jgi:hypothetical protein
LNFLNYWCFVFPRLCFFFLSLLTFSWFHLKYPKYII